MNLYGVLMAGGTGTRFWPRSRQKMPKQVLNIFGENTMIQETQQRLSGLVKDKHVLIVTNAVQQEVIARQLPVLDEQNYIIEPFGRNTAPCIGLAALHIAHNDPDGVMVVLPADHLITQVPIFQSVIKVAAEFAYKENALVTLGITPNEPATGYGYIQASANASQSGEHAVHRVKTFAEKPNLETATRFLDSGDFYWNSGMFIWKASTILKEIAERLPELSEQLSELEKSIGTAGYPEALAKMYSNIDSISIDIGVMQQAENVFVIPVDMGWNDVGSWETVHEISSRDRHGHAGQYDELINIGANNCYVYSPEKVVALVGVKDLIVVDTGDALLVCSKSEAQSVKDAVDYLSKKGRTSHL